MVKGIPIGYAKRNGKAHLVRGSWLRLRVEESKFGLRVYERSKLKLKPSGHVSRKSALR